MEAFGVDYEYPRHGLRCGNCEMNECEVEILRSPFDSIAYEVVRHVLLTVVQE